MSNNIVELLKERDVALSNLDLKWAASVVKVSLRAVGMRTDDETLLLAMHKSRYQCLSIAKELRHESEKFLRDGGWKRLNGLPLLPEGELPDINS